MRKLSRIARVDVALAALVAALAAMPALAALPVEIPFVGKGLPMRDWILMGSLALLAVAVALRLMRQRAGAEEPLAEGQDLRWWRNP
jgi:hypothetical protein